MAIDYILIDLESGAEDIVGASEGPEDDDYFPIGCPLTPPHLVACKDKRAFSYRKIPIIIRL